VIFDEAIREGLLLKKNSHNDEKRTKNDKVPVKKEEK
jgi:hypothetical protein